MAYDGLVNYSIVHELKNKIINGKIDKIYEPNFDEIVLGIYSNGEKLALQLVVNPQFYRANLTTNIKPNPSQAPNFCMTLRKYLVGTRIIDIYTNNLERIIFIELEGYNKSKDMSKKKLVIELMGKHSNIILLDNENIIIDALKHFSINSGSYRNIFSGEKYILPKSDKLDFFDIKDKEEFYRVIINNSAKLNNSKSLSNVIANTFTGFSNISIKAFEEILNISDNIEVNAIYKLFDYITNILKDCNNNICKIFDNKNDYYLLNILDGTKKDILQINWFLDDYYTSKEINITFLTYRNSLLKLILNKLHKLNSKLDTINKKVEECKDTDKYRLYGELITSNLYRIDNYNSSSITIENYYDNNNLITIPLDKSITPSANAKKYFKRYQKLKNAKSIVDNQKLNIMNDINYLESIVFEIESASDIEDIDEIYTEIQELNLNLKNIYSYDKKNPHKETKQSKKEKVHVGEPLKFNIDNFVVLVGKNNKQNDYLTTKIASKDDIWLHVKDLQGSHVIIKTENKIPSQDTINKCAQLAKKYSKAEYSSNITVDYTLVKYVKKPSGSKPGMVIYTNNSSVIVQ